MRRGSDIKFLCAAIVLSLLLTGCANVGKQQKNKISAFKNKVIPSAPISRIRINALQSAARSIGTQAGLSWEAYRINRTILKRSKFLSTIYDFRMLMLRHNVLPPILVEAHNLLDLKGRSSITLADRVYKIIKPARFVTAVPTWRDYLLLHFSAPETPDSSLLPKNNIERDMWNGCVYRGWLDGIHQANDMFALGMHRLNRDYLGMILYRKLLAQNIVTPPFISRTQMGITGNHKELRINDRIMHIAAQSQLLPNSKLWKARVVSHLQGGTGMLRVKPKRTKVKKIGKKRYIVYKKAPK